MVAYMTNVTWSSAENTAERVIEILDNRSIVLATAGAL
jgi:hypothetical protein